MLVGRFNNYHEVQKDSKSLLIKWLWENKMISWPVKIQFVSRSYRPDRRYIIDDGRSIAILSKSMQFIELLSRPPGGIVQMVEWMQYDLVMVSDNSPIVLKDQVIMPSNTLKERYLHKPQQRVFCSNTHVYYLTAYSRIIKVGKDLTESLHNVHGALPELFMVMLNDFTVVIDALGSISTSRGPNVCTVSIPAATPSYCNLFWMPTSSLTMVVAHTRAQDPKADHSSNWLVLIQGAPSSCTWKQTYCREVMEDKPLDTVRKLKRGLSFSGVLLSSTKSRKLYLVASSGVKLLVWPLEFICDQIQSISFADESWMVVSNKCIAAYKFCVSSISY